MGVKLSLIVRVVYSIINESTLRFLNWEGGDWSEVTPLINLGFHRIYCFNVIIQKICILSK
jgi:hypothetical protein